ncbi:MAG: dihydroorotate dehydrogenase [Candidatus Bathyarchaeia archaeon]
MNLSVELAGVRMGNPLMNASGILGLTSNSLLRLAQAGVGAVVTKSIGREPRPGFKAPNIVELEVGLINSMGLPNPGVDEYVKELDRALEALKVPLIASVYGCSPEDYRYVSTMMCARGASAVELNVSCPHVKEVGAEVGQNVELLSEVIKAVKAAVNVPVFVKLSPNVSRITTFAKAAEEAGADGLVAINTVKAMAIDVEAGRPILGGKFGGLSGPAIKPIALRCVYEIFETVKIPIIGCGGVTTWEDAVEFMMAGASALQIGTAIVHKDLRVFREILAGLSRYLNRKGLRSPSDIIGVAHR